MRMCNTDSWVCLQSTRRNAAGTRQATRWLAARRQPAERRQQQGERRDTLQLRQCQRGLRRRPRGRGLRAPRCHPRTQHCSQQPRHGPRHPARVRASPLTQNTASLGNCKLWNWGWLAAIRRRCSVLGTACWCGNWVKGHGVTRKTVHILYLTFPVAENAESVFPCENVNGKNVGSSSIQRCVE